jgi:hypothetical protein
LPGGMVDGRRHIGRHPKLDQLFKLNGIVHDSSRGLHA